MIKWLDRMINWGHIVVPLFITLVVLLLGRIGCSEESIKTEESVEERSEVTSSLKDTTKHALLR